MTARAAALILAVLLGGCDAGEGRPTSASVKLGHGIAATVGDEVVAARQVVAIANARGLRSVDAREAAIHDALFAAAARAEGLADTTHAETRTLARALLAGLTAEAREAPLDDAELENWTMARFIDVDRPPGFRVVHVVVLIDARVSAEARLAALEHAERVRSTIAPIVQEAARRPAPKREGEDVFLDRPGIPEDPVASALREAVAAMNHGDLETRYESLGVVSEDGRHIDYARSPWERVLEAFSRAASKLRERGDVSPVVETELESNGKALRGFHVIALLERTSELRMADADRRRFLTPVIQDARANSARKRLLESLRSRTRVTVERNANALLEALGSPDARAPETATPNP
ncbi:MAG: hypothetical protein FJ096_21300 [Deltaproteobacteria bacterium]|nr:hypothetical protein [Deltaproteobacteria bacterium]